jgi:hypothetical protein
MYPFEIFTKFVFIDRSEPKHIFAHDGDRDGVQLVAKVDSHGNMLYSETWL